MVQPCTSGLNWDPIDGPDLVLANDMYFSHTITVVEPFPEGTTSWIQLEGVSGHWVDGVLSIDRRTFTYLLAPPGSDDTEVQDRAEYEFWVIIPNEDTEIDEPWKWYMGEVRRKD